MLGKDKNCFILVLLNTTDFITKKVLRSVYTSMVTYI